MAEEANLIEETEELEDLDEWASVIKPDPMESSLSGVSVDPEVVRKVLFTERVVPVRKPVPVVHPVALPKRPLNPELQKLKNNLKSMIFEAWNELEK
jgi:hypothetical protein